MEWNIRVTDPAGNITILVKTPAKKAEYATIAGKLLSVVDDAEQVGFLVPPENGGKVRLEMMGGEFCGNALRSAAFCYAVESGCLNRTEVLTEISGAEKPLPVLVDVEKNIATAMMPIPKKMISGSFQGNPVEVVIFDGIVHLVTTKGWDHLSEAKLKNDLRLTAKEYDVAAAGLMFYDDKAKSLKPAVYVVATDTLFYENSCASGSAAIAVTRVMPEMDGIFLFHLKEPGGVIEATAEKKDGQLLSLQIGGKITLSPERAVDI